MPIFNDFPWRFRIRRFSQRRFLSPRESHRHRHSYSAINNSIVRQIFFLHLIEARDDRDRLVLLIFVIIMTERWNTLASKPLSVLYIYIYICRCSSRLVSFPFFTVSPLRWTNISIAAKLWQPMSDERTATLMNRLCAAHHMDITVLTATSWNCCTPFLPPKSWQINRNRRGLNRFCV